MAYMHTPCTCINLKLAVKLHVTNGHTCILLFKTCRDTILGILQDVTEKTCVCRYCTILNITQNEPTAKRKNHTYFWVFN